MVPLTTQAVKTDAKSEPIPRGSRIATLAEQRLHESSYPQLREVLCTFHEGILVLHGKLNTYYLKQIAQTLVGKLDGVDQVLNRIEVRASAGS